MELKYLTELPLGNRKIELHLTVDECQVLHSFCFSLAFEALSHQIDLDPRRSEPGLLLDCLTKYSGRTPSHETTTERPLHDLADFIIRRAQTDMESGATRNATEPALALARAIHTEMTIANMTGFEIPDQLPPDFA